MHPLLVSLRPSFCLGFNSRASASRNCSSSRYGSDVGVVELRGGIRSGFTGLRVVKSLCSSADVVVVRDATQEVREDEKEERDAAHVPVVLKEEVGLRLLNYVECALGAGGHACAVFSAHSEMETFVGFYIDPVPHAEAQPRLQKLELQETCNSSLNVHLIPTNFSNIKTALLELQLADGGVDGILMDLGMSSMQNATDLVVLKNGMLDPFLESKGLGSATQVPVYFAVAKFGDVPTDGITDLNPEGLTAESGKWASAIAARITSAGIACKVLDAEELKKPQLERLIWICAFMLVGARHPGATVGDVESKYREELANLIQELAAAVEFERDMKFDSAVVERICAHGRSVAHFPTAVKEFEWKNGFFYSISQRALGSGQSDPCQLHTALLKEVGAIGRSLSEPDTEDQQREQSAVGAALQTAEADDDERNIGEREKLRRQRIGMANKGRVPWNKGRQHSPETIERIKQKTYQAMHSPKQVKAKLKLNPRHPQSDATRVKIRDKLREQWDLKKMIRGYQEACLKEWKECVAEAARVGAPGEEEYAWNSYSVMKRKLRDQERSARKSSLAVPKSRPVKSDEHRRKISAAIRAKWEDPEYQQKVREGMTKTEKDPTPQRVKDPPLQRIKNSPTEKRTSSEIAMEKSFIDAVMSDEKPSRMSRSEAQELDEQHTVSPPFPTIKKSAKTVKKVNLLQRVVQRSEVEEKGHIETTKPVDSGSLKSSLLLDPEANEKLQKLKLLQANRSIMEQRRRESAYHARLLMAEAEKAARVLEAAAIKDEFAMASLSETRRLMAEAARLIQTAESGNGRMTRLNQSS